MTVGRQRHSLFIAGGIAVAAGGLGGVQSDTTSEAYNSVGRVFSGVVRAIGGSHNEARDVVLDSNRAVLIGGSSDTSVSMYDALTGTWQPADPLSTSRIQAAAVRLLDGSVLVTGGTTTGPAVLGSAQINRGFALSATGEPCTADVACASNHCADGVCCDSACTETCRSCAVPGMVLGTCTNVPAGQDPRNVCPDAGETTCRSDGTCNGNGACRLYSAGTPCAAATCSGSTLTAPTCDGIGTCRAVPTSNCSPYTCGTGACRATCSADADCMSSYVCIGSACVPNPNLEVQYQAAERNPFASAIQPWFRIVNNGTSAVPLSSLTLRYHYTLEGTSPETPVCSYAPFGCNDVTLRNVARAFPGTGADHYFEVGFTSTAGSLAPGGGTTGELVIWFHKDDWSGYDQTNDYSFDATKVAFTDWDHVTLYQGGTLAWGVEPAGNSGCGVDADCPASAHFCVDSVCCDSRCGSGNPNDCQACSVAAGAPVDGICTLLGSSRICRTAAGPCDVAEVCTGASPTCPANEFKDATTVCHTASSACESTVTCTGTSAGCAPSGPLPCTTLQGTVSWNGSPVTGTVAAGLEVFGTGATSSWQASVDLAGVYASGNIAPGNYGLRLVGGSCGSAGGGDSLASASVSAVAAATTTVANFDITASAGLVTGTILRGGLPVPATITINGGDCTTLVTDSNGHFAAFFVPGNYVATPTLSGTTLGPFAFSVQRGQITDLSASISAPAPDGGVGGGGSDAGSAGGDANGTACADASSCASGFCVDGVCCATLCGATCKSCAVAGSLGTCINVPEGQDPRNVCVDAGAATCGFDGACNGSGACRLHSPGTPCTPAICSGSTFTPARTCNGTGTCQTATTSSCQPYACGASACRTSCTSNADCRSPNICVGTSCMPNPFLKVQYMAADIDATGQVVKPHFKVFNNGTSAVALSSLTIRYWYALDPPVAAESTQCDFAQLGCNNITLSNVALSPVRTTADHYFQVAFASTAGNLAAGANTGEIQVWFHKDDWSNYVQVNDYSFDATKTAYADWGRVTLYENGTLVWGTEPDGSPGCRIDAECPSNRHFCVDSVCCDTACGGGDPKDCQACSVTAGAPTNGTCAVLKSSRICRDVAGPCDVAERCNGSTTDCPADGFQNMSFVPRRRKRLRVDGDV